MLVAFWCAQRCAGTDSAGSAAPPPPNFLCILADDCTFRDLGCYGGQALTPHIDRLASEGARFTRCFQAAPLCSPTRHNLLTGLYPVRSGALPNDTFVKPGTRSIVHYLRPLGYRVALSGKQHIAPPEAFPFEYSSRGSTDPDFEAVGRLFVQCAASQTPFCLFVCSYEPHEPWNRGDWRQYDPGTLQLPPYFVDTPETREAFARYLAEITVFDQQVGHCLQLLEQNGLRQNTIVLLLSEQGSGFPFGKGTCYDTGLQSACVVRWPGVIDAGSTRAAMIEYVDFLPTLVELAGGTVDPVWDGRSFASVLKGQSDQHKQHVYGVTTTRGMNRGPEYYGIRSVRDEHFKYIRNLTPEVSYTNKFVQGPIFESWMRQAAQRDAEAERTVRRFLNRSKEELYDIDADPYELNNLASDPRYTRVKQELSDRLDQWMHSQGDQGQQTELEAHKRVYRKNREKQ